MAVLPNLCVDLQDLHTVLIYTKLVGDNPASFILMYNRYLLIPVFDSQVLFLINIPGHWWSI